MSNTFSHTYEIEEMPGVQITGTSVIRDGDDHMTVVMEIEGGRGKVTVDYDADREVTLTTDALTKNLNQAIQKLALIEAENLLGQLFGGALR